MKKALQFLPFVIIIFIIITIGFSSEDKNDNIDFFPGRKINNIKTISEEINTLKLTESFEDIKLFNFIQSSPYAELQNKVLKSGQNLQLNRAALNALLKNPKENILFKIPVSKSEFLELELTRTYVFSGDAKFSLLNSKGKTSYNFKPGLFFKGIIKDDNNSIAGISIFENEVIGVISNKKGNFVLGKYENGNNKNDLDYIFYKDVDLINKKGIKCGVNDNDSRLIKTYNYNKNNNPKYFVNFTPDTIRFYFEADYSVYTAYQNSIYSVPAHIAAIFLETAMLLQNIQIPTLISEVSVWTVQDPYSNLNNALDILKLFGSQNKDNFYGNIGHLISFGHTQNLGYDGIAWVNVLCNPYNTQDSSGRFAFYNLDTLFQGIPLYSRTVEVMTHQTGHNIGSKHTNACVWPTEPGIIGAIDSCAPPESGNCFSQTQPDSNATIMSLCDLYGGVINLGLGFGPLPSDTLQFCYTHAPCISHFVHSTEYPETFILDQNFPNPFNPGTSIQFGVPYDAYITLKVFDITGKEVARLLNSRFYSKGNYNTNFNAVNYSLSSGVYFYQITAYSQDNSKNAVFTQVRKMILTK
jgi:hypothetical protein